jgi:hypothetical protein
MNKTLAKYAEQFLTNNREVMEDKDIAELELALAPYKERTVLSNENFREYLMSMYRQTSYDTYTDDTKWQEFLNTDFVISFKEHTTVLANNADLYTAILDTLTECI